MKLEEKRELLLRLRILLAPQGIITVTTGGDEIGAFLQKRYGTHETHGVREAWYRDLEKIADAKAIIIGIPMDAGAGFERGSFKGPLGVRTHLLEGGFYETMEGHGIVDVGDVFVNPHLIDDSYYTDKLLDSVRQSRLKKLEEYDESAAGIAKQWLFPIAPHSAYLEALQIIRKLNPGVKIASIGGDHSTSRIPCAELTDASRDDQRILGILHFDAHTDLLDLRDGTPYNFATWAYHANDMIGRKYRMVQVGIRVSGRPREEWEESLQLTQIRMDQINPNEPDSVLAKRVVDLFKKAGVERIFISNDIDGTDPVYAASTGTMEPGGLRPETVRCLIAEVGEYFDVVGGDLTEVAPPLKWHVPGEPERTLRTASSYFVELLESMLRTTLTTEFDEITPASAESLRKG